MRKNQTTIKKFHPHPLFIIRNLWQYLFLLLIPMFRMLYSLIVNSFSWIHGFHLEINLSAWLKGVWMDAAVAMLILSLGVLQWLCFAIEVSKDGILIRKGIFRREVRFIPVSRCHCILTMEPFHLKIFKALEVRVDTPGGGTKQADLSLLIGRSNCIQMLNILRYRSTISGFSQPTVYSPKSRYVFILAMITSNSFAGLILISTFITQVGNILGQQFSEMIYGTFENVARTLAFGIPPAAFALACVLLFGYLFAFVASLSRHANFHVVRWKDILQVKAGLITKRRYSLQVEKIAYLDIRRSLLTFVLGVYSVFISTVGYGKFRDDVSALIPCVRKKQLEKNMSLLLPEYHLSQRSLCPNRVRSIFRYTWRSAALLVLLQAGRLVLCGFFPSWQELIRWVCLMASFPMVWLLAVKVIDLNTAGISYKDGCYTLRYSKGFSLHQVVIRPERIAKIKRVQSIFQRRTGRCDLYIYSYSEGTNVHHIRDLKKEDAEKLFIFLEERKEK